MIYLFVALFREVWPEGDSFGQADSVAEEDFMALREILFADLGVSREHVAGRRINKKYFYVLLFIRPFKIFLLEFS